LGGAAGQAVRGGCAPRPARSAPAHLEDLEELKHACVRRQPRQRAQLQLADARRRLAAPKLEDLLDQDEAQQV
jgi:hypothetical protein